MGGTLEFCRTEVTRFRGSKSTFSSSNVIGVSDFYCRGNATVLFRSHESSHVFRSPGLVFKTETPGVSVPEVEDDKGETKIPQRNDMTTVIAGVTLRRSPCS